MAAATAAALAAATTAVSQPSMPGMFVPWFAVGITYIVLFISLWAAFSKGSLRQLRSKKLLEDREKRRSLVLKARSDKTRKVSSVL